MNLTTNIPSGLQKGNAGITATNYDPETGKSSEESKSVNLLITEGSPLRLREAEPNNAVSQATEVVFPSIIEGDITSGESGELVYAPANGDKLPIPDLYRFSAATRLEALIELSYLNEGDLELFIYRSDSQGRYELLATSANNDNPTGGGTKSVSGTLLAGDYLIGVAARSGKAVYTLRLLNRNGN